MKDKYKIGNAQSIGSYYIQSNYFSTKNGNCALAVLADGSIDHINGRRCAVLAVEAFIRGFYNSPAGKEVLEMFDSIAADILKEIRELVYIGKMPCLSFSVMFIRDKQLFYYTVGDNKVFIYDGRDYKVMKERRGQADFGRRMTAGMFSCGAWEALQEKEIVSCLQKYIHPFDKAQNIVMGINKKNRKKTGNATVILVEDAL